MANLLIAFPNRADEVTLSGGSWSSTLPLANLQTSPVRKVARTSDADSGNTWFEIDAGAGGVNVALLALVNHNFSASARVRIMGANDAAFGTLLYDSGFETVWPSLYAYDELDWEDENWWLGTADASSLGSSGATYMHVLSAATRARYWRVLIDDTANADGYVEAGRLFVGPGWRPDVNFEYGSGMQWTARADMEESLNGTRYFTARSVARRWQLDLGWLSANEAKARVLEMQRQLGQHGELFVVPDSDEADASIRSFLARIERAAPVVEWAPSLHRTTLEISEVL